MATGAAAVFHLMLIVCDHGTKGVCNVTETARYFTAGAADACALAKLKLEEPYKQKFKDTATVYLRCLSTSGDGSGPQYKRLMLEKELDLD
ncbi:TPA: hypothetical protein ACGJ4G_000694 [Pseudomonas aeruginosa]